MSGYSEQELLDMRIPDLEAIESAEDVAARTRKIIARGQDRFESRHRRKDGSLFDVENSVSFQPETGRFAAFVRDITRRRQREEYGRLSREVLVILNEPGDPYDSLQRIVTAIMHRTGFDAVGIRMREGEDYPYLASEGFTDGHLQSENELIAHNEAGETCRDEHGDVVLECTCGLVLSGRGDPLLSPGGSFWTSDSFPLLDLTPEDDPRLHPRNVCILEGFASVALVPIRDKQRIVGLVHLADHRKGCFSGETVELLEGIAIHLGEAMTRKRAEERLARTLTSVIDIARDIVEVRDPYTAGHQLRVCEIAVRIAQDLGMSDPDVDDIRIAALIHDVGKVVVPTEILSKPGTISKTEYELLKAHAEAGHRILVGAHMEEPVPELVYQHHERCDGSGYPRALTGDQMLMGAKVIAVADVVEAMTSHRPYRPALGLDAALAEIERGAGRLYDADVARACIALFREQHFELSVPPT
jgi:HD-GYP domain-containing protein (c-di-GMP phosphodiesterase class II)